jgi:hypothetical protein
VVIRWCYMIVYGDPAYAKPLGWLEQQFQACVRSIAPTPTVDEARMLVIFAGQIEQAAHDRLAENYSAQPVIQFFEQQTDVAADIFYALLCGREDEVGKYLAALSRLSQHTNINAYTDSSVRVKIPEGFAFYTLFPEQYCASAKTWAEQHRMEHGDVLVVGIRSIGTTLSALVTSVLKSSGRAAKRITVRPTGHPFSRQTLLPPDVLQSAEYALIVDEGPGISGSSMASVGHALEQAGLPPKRMTILPGHAGQPGSAASDAVRAWWAEVSRIVTPLEAVRWAGRSLIEDLAAKTAELTGYPVQQVVAWGGGLWRQSVYRDETDWPQVCQAFERSKYLCITEKGSVVWKFAGFPLVPTDKDAVAGLSEDTYQKLQLLAERGFTPAPLGVQQGFVALPFVEGAPLRQDDATAELFAHIGRYIAAAAGQPMDMAEAGEAHRRVCEMVYWNIWEVLGEEMAERLKPVLEAISPQVGPTYGDGHLAPHEWRRSRGGGLLKLDAGGHCFDHTVLGKQSVLWDVAGALCEWDADQTTETALVDAFREASASVVDQTALGFYQLSYTAFKAGQYRLCASMSEGTEEARLTAAFELWKRKLLPSIQLLLLGSR